MMLRVVVITASCSMFFYFTLTTATAAATTAQTQTLGHKLFVNPHRNCTAAKMFKLEKQQDIINYIFKCGIFLFSLLCLKKKI